MQHEMTQRVAVLPDVLFVCGSNAYTQVLWNFTSRSAEFWLLAVLLDVLFICGSNACTKSCGISPQGKQSFGCCLCATDQDLQLM